MNRNSAKDNKKVKKDDSIKNARTYAHSASKIIKWQKEFYFYQKPQGKPCVY